MIESVQNRLEKYKVSKSYSGIENVSAFYRRSESAPRVDEEETLIRKCEKYLESTDSELIRRAFRKAKQVHSGQLRKSGQPYYKHNLAVAEIIVDEMPLDDVSVAAALLHDSTEEPNKYSRSELRAEFGDEIADIVAGMEKIKRTEAARIREFESYRRLLLALLKDPRIILVKLADRLHNMRTLKYLAEDSQKKIAEETLSIYVPFSQRFGLGDIKWELEDLSFKFMNREAFLEIKNALRLSRKEREEYIQRFIDGIDAKCAVDDGLRSAGIKYEIFGRAKHIYSIYNKTILRDKPIERLYDLFAIRIILDTKDSSYCYYIYGLLAEIYKPIAGTFKDYVSNPKPNGYQSIHGAFLGPGDRPVEVQIRTLEMHAIAEKGVAAHFNYKRGVLPENSILNQKSAEEWISGVREAVRKAGTDEARDAIEALKLDSFDEEIFVLTPANDLRVFPKGSCPLDFAYSVHTEVGEGCIGAKVDGKVVPLEYEMKTGEKIEILTSKKAKPKREYLKFVKTHKARNGVLKYFNDIRKIKIASGKDKWKEIKSKLKGTVRAYKLRKLLVALDIPSENDFYLALGAGKLDESKVVKYYSSLFDKPSFASGKKNGRSENIVNGFFDETPATINPNIRIEFCPTCSPIPGDEILGALMPGEGMEIHRADCPLAPIAERRDYRSVFKINWNSLPRKNNIAGIKIKGNNGSSAGVSAVSTALKYGGQILGFDLESENGDSEAVIKLRVEDKKELEEIIAGIEELAEVESARRI